MAGTTRPRFVPVPAQDSEERGRLILRDGSVAHLRPARPGDRDALTRFFCDLSAESRYRRFMSASMPGPDLITRLAVDPDPHSALTLVVTRGTEADARVIATGSYMARDARSAEVALAVADAFQGKGLGSLLLERLALLAVRHGFVRFWAVTSLDNTPMMRVFRESGFEVRDQVVRGGIEIDLGVVPTAASVGREELRDRVATVASLVPFFRPNAVAVVGASRDPAAIGHRVLEGAIRSGFRGGIYPVNPKAATVAGLRAYPAARDLPERVDLAVIAVPAAAVPGAIDDCAAAGVRAVVVLTAGFAEVGGGGAALQRALVEKVRGYGMRMVGPNCLGVLNADAGVRLSATFAPVFPPPGRIGMSSQSGAVGLAAMGAAARYGLGFSTFASVGNKADVSGNDLLQYWEEDPNTDVVLLYLESFGNPRRFARIARRVGRRKPVVVLQSGLTRSGGRATGSHTAALATNATAVQALFRQTGVVQAASLEEMFDLALTLGNQPVPRGRRVSIVTNAGGPGVLSADACEAGGLAVPEPSAALRDRLAVLLPGAASVGNPIDLIAAAGPEAYRRALDAVLTSGEFDAVLVLYTPVGLAEPGDVRKAIASAVAGARAAGATGVPVLACVLDQDADRGLLECPGERVPCYPFPETPARVLGKVAAYGAWRDQPDGAYPDFPDLHLAIAQSVCREVAAKRGGDWLAPDEARAVLEAAGLPLVPTESAATAEEAVAVAERIGFPVAVKLASRRIVHKSDAGGVHLGLTSAAAVRAAFADIRERVRRGDHPDAMDGVTVQPMLRGGVEVMAGVTHDPLFGPLVAFGLGGVHVEVLGDVAFRVAPLTDRDAAEMVRGIRGYRLLEGYRGHPPADVAALEEALLRLSRLAEEVPEIAEIDLNPVFAFPPGEGCRVADARVRVRPVR
ncbi:-binding protein : Putative Acyl-CoA synthetase (NDP forming) OS=Candidatus Nitrospira defluvii GN=NIDE3866 PE=4 SV=1: Acetyltransf_1: CoA_binding_2: Succ_CoA_lig: ATP-grasp_5 [Gemmataceae bacterium]|nr:-binding protein : Putative Acyl-CoA synthetase (NDP forming) OS=Candidatus Nitrospira defluvii GN=NIDE3866 PE=4 SV=1: Acetyltransf_1: CoA_binding_2: Succ_CoA_lig: ATP-grasp_5 [Gemmataceae bacterium]VTT99278.1 -binding protein : Putative Acyl-CoA synthetase (NDP forming) OS=Candidatus Nitrospira defluvii GN=NIDE3866 PE=4 SV=1: Acetyltransf_1: CoA_binding_2: Succ_CoA_lig: ATP-grasp_5 [Gemmataceae bacterium]